MDFIYLLGGSVSPLGHDTGLHAHSKKIDKKTTHEIVCRAIASRKVKDRSQANKPVIKDKGKTFLNPLNFYKTRICPYHIAVTWKLRLSIELFP